MRRFLVLFGLVGAWGSPVLIPENQKIDLLTPEMPPNLCALPPEIGYSGLSILAEDCTSLGRYKGKPPHSINNQRGSGIYICCPFHDADGTDSPIFFPGDFAEVEEDEGGYDYPAEEDYFQFDNIDYGELASNQQERLKSCNEGTFCLDLDECGASGAFDQDRDTPPKPCDWDKGTGIEKFCCNATNGGSYAKPAIPKKYPGYECEDYNKECPKFVEVTPESCRPDHESYDFMRHVCMKSCRRCANKGCQDEFEMCSTWAKAGQCARNTRFMHFHCRESCGSCGFLSPRNSEEQVVGDISYSNIYAENFLCGEGERRELQKRKRRQVNDEEEYDPFDDVDFKFDEVFYYATEGSVINCGSIIINDRFVISAAHCTDKHLGENDLRGIVLRDNTENKDFIALRRIFIHPSYQVDSPTSLYNDIAIAELDRRIEFDFDKYGDTPACLGFGRNLDGRRAIVQGYGRTETGQPSATLLEANVTIINSQDCSRYLTQNYTNDEINFLKLQNALSNGINDQLLCSTGLPIEVTNRRNRTFTVWTGPCPGDSGGPLYVNYGSDGFRRQTLEGIVSGGIGCGRNTPKWYTRVSSYLPWIRCIMENVGKGLPQKRIERFCMLSAGNFREENKIAK